MPVGSLPILKVVPPDDIADSYLKKDSGYIEATKLVSIGPAGQLHHDAARAYKALAFLCMSVGLPLTYTYGGTYRNYGNQVTLFLQRYVTTPIAGSSTKVWNGVTYWLRKGMAMAAVPGTSNHGWGIAVDFAFDSDVSDGIGPDDAATITSHPQWLQFKIFATACGFSWESTSEPWHLRLITGSHPTQKVLDVEAIMYPTTQPSEEDDEMSNVRFVRHKGFINVFMLGAGPAISVAGEVMATYPDAPRIFIEDNQPFLRSLCFQSGIDMNNNSQLIAGGIPGGF